MSALNVTPCKSFFCVVLFSTAFTFLYSSSMFPSRMYMHLHFPLNNICHFSDHSIHLSRVSRPSYKLCLSVSFVTFLMFLTLYLGRTITADGSRRRGRLKETWRRTVENETKECDVIWDTLARRAIRHMQWRSLVDLCATKRI